MTGTNYDGTWEVFCQVSGTRAAPVLLDSLVRAEVCEKIAAGTQHGVAAKPVRRKRMQRECRRWTLVLLANHDETARIDAQAPKAQTHPGRPSVAALVAMA